MAVDVEGLIKQAEELVKALKKAQQELTKEMPDPDEFKLVAEQAQDLTNQIEQAWEDVYEVTCG